MAARDAGGSAADAVTRVMCAREISRPYRRLKHGLTTLASAFSREGENARPRVQVVAEPGKMRGSERWRWDSPRFCLVELIEGSIAVQAAEIVPKQDLIPVALRVPRQPPRSPGSG